VSVLILFAGVLAVFFSQHGTGRWMKLPAGDRRRGLLLGLAGTYALIAVVSAGHLAVNEQLWLLAPGACVGAVVFASSLWIEDRRKDHTAGGEILGMFGLTLSCPAAYYVATGELGPTAIALWLAAALFYAGSVFRVRLQVRGFKARSTSFGSRLRAAGFSAVFHVAALTLVWILCEHGRLPQGMQLAMLAPTIEALWGVAHSPSRRLHVRNIGFKELAYSVAFLVVAVTAFRAAL
jgi:4-hydroxybenzoate polyprenyltransferase